MSRPRLVVHGHFYQPFRIDPATGEVPPDPSAAPWRDWNTRITEDCYRPNARLGNFGRISWDLGPTLAEWLDDADPETYHAIANGDQGSHGMAQPFHHTILPLATTRDRRTEIRWGLRDFELRHGRRARGVWLPETAVDTETLRLLVDEGVEHTILAPWQLADGRDPRYPYRVDVGDGRSIAVALYDGGLSTSVSFEPGATSDADRFARERVLPRLFEDGDDPGDGPARFALIATDGELYGHHQPFRDLFLARLVGDADLGYDVATLDEVIHEGARPAPATLVERTSWSCHHGVTRWTDACGCISDGSWKAPLRALLDRFAVAVDFETERIAERWRGSVDVWAARDAYVDVVTGWQAPAAFADAWLGEGYSDLDRRGLLAVMTAQRWRLAMFASCGWFWEIPDRVETGGVIRAARQAAAILDGLSGSALAAALDADLADWAGNPSARGLRATG